MKRVAFAAILGTVLLLVSNLTLADFDQRDEDEAKAFELQNREAARKEALRKQKLEADNTKAKADMFRQALGAQANGKSDAEVIAMMKAQQDAAERRYGQQAQEAGKTQDHPMSEEQADQALKQALEKASGDESMSMEELANMSDAELEALARKAAKRQ